MGNDFNIVKIVIALGVVSGAVIGIVAVLFGIGTFINWLDSTFETGLNSGDAYINAGWILVIIVVIFFIILACIKIYNSTR